MLIEQDEQGRRCIVGEIGVAQGHPWRSNHSVTPHLPARSPEVRTSERYLKGVAPTVFRMIERFVTARTLRWTESAFIYRRPKERSSARRKEVSVVTRNGQQVKKSRDIPRGLSFSVDPQDVAVQRFFEELEWPNPYLARRIYGIARHLDALTGSYRFGLLRKPYPKGVDEALKILQRPDGLVLLRPHVLAAIARQLRCPGLLLDALSESGVITEDQYVLITKLLTWHREPTFSFRILPREIQHDGSQWGDKLLVILRRRYPCHNTFEVAYHPSVVESMHVENAKSRGVMLQEEIPAWVLEE